MTRYYSENKLLVLCLRVFYILHLLHLSLSVLPLITPAFSDAFNNCWWLTVLNALARSRNTAIDGLLWAFDVYNCFVSSARIFSWFVTLEAELLFWVIFVQKWFNSLVIKHLFCFKSTLKSTKLLLFKIIMYTNYLDKYVNKILC